MMTLNVVCNNTAVNLYVKKQVFICTCSHFKVTSQRPAIWRKHNWWRSWWTECCQLPARFSGHFARNKAPAKYRSWWYFYKFWRLLILYSQCPASVSSWDNVELSPQRRGKTWLISSALGCLFLICQIYPNSGRKIVRTISFFLFFSDPFRVMRLKFRPPGNAEVEKEVPLHPFKTPPWREGREKAGVVEGRTELAPSCDLAPPPPHPTVLRYMYILYTTHSKRLNTPM
jgi:hypothetical protein